MALTRALVESGIGVAEVVQRRESLEERFLEITRAEEPEPAGRGRTVVIRALSARSSAGRGASSGRPA